MGFGSGELSVYRRKWDGQVVRVIGGIMQEQKFSAGTTLMDLLVSGTPVDEGELRRSWHYSVNYPTEEDVKDRNFSSHLLELLGDDIGGWDITVWIQNNAKHAPIIEYGLFRPTDPGPSKDPRAGRRGRILVSGGYSIQAPTGITGDALDAAASTLDLTRI